MAPSKIIDRTSPAVIRTGAPPMRASRLPPYLRLLILLVINLSITSGLWTLATTFMGNELGPISKRPDQDDMLTLTARLLYKIGLVWAGWGLNYDYMDISALTAIADTPYTYLLTTYYNITSTTVATKLIIDILAIAIPTFLLRSRSVVNNPNAPLRSRYLLNSSQVNATNVLLAIGVYVVVLFSVVKTGYLNIFLITRFDLPTVEGAHGETGFTLIFKLLLAGAATKHFLLNPSLGATPAPGDATPVEIFDPPTATLPQTVKHNLWFFSRRTRTLMQQTAIASLFLFLNTVRESMSLEDTNFVGAAGYSSIWIVANVICAGWWAWIGDAEL